MNNRLTLAGLAFATVLMSACGGYIKIEKSENFIKNKKAIAKNEIYFFPPETRSIRAVNAFETNYDRSAKLKELHRKHLLSAAQKNGIKAVYLDQKTGAESPEAYINIVLKLKNRILSANNLQDHPLNNTGRSMSTVVQGVFVVPPTIGPEYASLSKVLGTPYVGISGIIDVYAKPVDREVSKKVRAASLDWGKYFYVYHIIVNIESGEIIYREIKQMPHKANSALISSALYDSFYYLKKNLKSK